MTTFARVATFFLAVAALSLARNVLMPLALAILFSFLLNPVSVWLERRRFGRVPAVVCSVLLFFLLLGGTLYVIGSEMTTLVQDTPRYKTEIIRKIRGLAGTGSGLGNQIDSIKEELTDALKGSESESTSTDQNALHPSANEDQQVAKEQPVQQDQPSKELPSNDQRRADESPAPADDELKVKSTPKSPIYTKEVDSGTSPIVGFASSLGYLAEPLGTASLVLVFTFFMMIYREDLRDRIIKVVSRGQYVTTTRAIGEASDRISRYLVAQMIVNVSYGIVIAVGLWLIGWALGGGVDFPNYLLWGFMCTLLRFVPYIGPVAAGLFPVLVSLAVYPGFTVFAAVLLLILTVELLSNNLMEPWLYGNSTGMSAMAVIFAAVFWGWLWGPIGLLLATPLTVCLVVMGKHVPQFRVFTTLFGEKEALPIPVQLYQRLLARDLIGAKLLAEKQIHQSCAEDFLDAAVIPTVRRIRKDKVGRRLSSSDERELLVDTNDLIEHMESLAEQQTQETTEASETDQTTISDSIAHIPRSLVYGIPAHDASEETILKALACVIESPRVAFYRDSTKTLPKMIESKIAAENPAVVVIALLPPGGLLQAEYMCRQLRSESAGRKIIVAYFNKTAKFDQLLVRLRKAGASYVTTSIEQTRLQVMSLLDEPGEIKMP